MLSITPQFFVDKWRTATLKERSSYQQHFLDLCQLVGHKTPAEMDPVGDTFCFEMGAAKSSGGNGFADVWYQDHFAFEYKGKHADLDKAYQQLLQYREALQNPPLLIVSDIDTIQIHTNFTGTAKRIYTLALNDLLTTSGMDLLRTAFYNPYSLQNPQTAIQVTEEAAVHFARLAERLRQAGNSPQDSAHFLIRLLFCLFAEDTGLLPEKLFTRLAVSFRNNPKAFTRQINDLFEAMSTGGGFGTEAILHFDGRLFDDAKALELDKDGIEILLAVSRLDWANIEPSIFGTLFERSLDPAKRSQLGAHYTSKDDILLIVEPVLMAPLRRQWAETKAQAQDLAAQRDAENERKKKTVFNNQLTNLLMGFADEVATVQVLDPACGSGNFLYIALRELLDLQKEIISEAGALGVGHFFPTVTPAQLHGIEINETAHQLAQATIQIGYIQWLRDNGFGVPPEPILKPLDSIANIDAIMTFDGQGQPIEPEWPQSDVIIGNPPFLGGKRMRSELSDLYVDNLFRIYANRVPHEADLVCYWFEKAKDCIKAGKSKRAGLLATQGIRGGANRKILEGIKEVGDIFWAQSDHNWVLDGATVHVSMIGFDDRSEKNYLLNGANVEKINPDLTSTVNTTIALPLRDNLGLSFMGVTPAGPFDVPEDLAQYWIKSKGNPNGRPNSDVIRPYYNGTDLTNGSRKVWIIDFGQMSEEQAAEYELPFEYAKKVILPIRSKNNRKVYREKWWIHAELRPAMRSALSNLTRYIGTSMVAKHRFFCWIPPIVLPANLIIVIARDDDYFFGVLNSRIHEVWARSKGTQLREAESGSRYTPSSTFETFPFPWVPGKEDKSNPNFKSICQAAIVFNEKRERWINVESNPEFCDGKRSLTRLYNQNPSWFQNSRRDLDSTVFEAYGWPADLSDEQILERLLMLNLERAAKK